MVTSYIVPLLSRIWTAHPRADEHRCPQFERVFAIPENQVLSVFLEHTSLSPRSLCSVPVPMQCRPKRGGKPSLDHVNIGTYSLRMFSMLRFGVMNPCTGREQEENRKKRHVRLGLRVYFSAILGPVSSIKPRLLC